MLFSAHNKIANAGSEPWFDPILDIDTQLFVDPFLIYKSSEPGFAGAHDKIVAFFGEAFSLAARSTSPRGTLHEKLVSMLQFHEPNWLCLGYAAKGNGGSGSGRGFGERIAGDIKSAIALGISEMDHFEEISLLSEGMGCDRISDAVANLLVEDFVAYTQQVCNRHKIATKTFQLLRFDLEALRWEPFKAKLPPNPFKTTCPVVLVPKAFLRELPTINQGDFRDYLWSTENFTLRNDFGYDVKRNLNKKAIMDLAKKNPAWLKQYLGRVETYTATPYDLDLDPDGRYQWEPSTRLYVNEHHLPKPRVTDAASFEEAVMSMVQEFKSYVELGSGYKLLWNDDGKPRDEKATQLLFLGVVRAYCQSWDVRVSREVETGRGPIDFEFSSGYKKAAAIEIKRGQGTVEHGLEQQLPLYMRANQTLFGVLLVVCHMDKEVARVQGLPDKAKQLSTSIGKKITVVIVDVRNNKLSASKAKPAKEGKPMLESTS